MSRKRYYGYKPPYEYYDVVLYEKKGNVGEKIFFVYDNGTSALHHLYYGSEMEYEYNRDDEVEHIDTFNEENTKLLMLRTGTHNGRDLANAIYQRFHQKESDAVSAIRTWCDQKNIKYIFNARF